LTKHYSAKHAPEGVSYHAMSYRTDYGYASSRKVQKIADCRRWCAVHACWLQPILDCGGGPIRPPVADEPAILVASVMPADELGIVVDEQNEVLQVEVGSAAEQAGIQAGDLLETLDDISFNEKDKVKEKIRDPKEGKKFTVKLKRNDEVITLDISPAPRRPHVDAPTPTPVLAPQDYF
jgi:membrane-associated protease RseP (regulator of RpoE activity)